MKSNGERGTAALRLYGLVMDSIVDGPGLRISVFTQGCPHHCPGCHNPESHDPTGGRDYTIAEITEAIRRNPLLTGITLTGGEPMEQAAGCLALLDALPRRLSRWIYSGYIYEAILGSGDEGRIALLAACDVLVDGPFLLAQRSLELSYCGSRNQRLIDLAKSREAGQAILWDVPAW